MVLIIGFSLSAASAWVYALSLPFNLLLATAVLALAAFLFWDSGLRRGGRQVSAAAWRQDGKWDLLLVNGESFSADLLSKTFALPLLTILWFQRLTPDGSSGQKYYLLLFPDSEASATLSLLRARITTDLKR